MFLGIANAISGLKSGGLSYIKDNLKLYLDFKSSRSDTLAFPSEGSTSFDGNDNKITFTRQVFSGAFTVSCWFNGDVNTNYKGILVDSTDINDTNIGVEDVDGQVRIYIGSGKAIVSSVPNNEWCHIAFTRDGSGNIKSYLNGVASGTSTGTDAFALDTIGRNCVMSMCNVAMWTRELSLEEINSVMNKSYSQLGSVEKTSLVSWWALDNTELGTNLVSNGDFSNGATGWTDIGTGWDLTGGNATSDNSQSGSSKIRQSVSLVQNKVYRVTYDWSYSSVGSVYFYLGSQSSGWHGTTGSNLTVDILYTGSTGAVNFDIYTGADSNATIDNISLQEFYTPDSKGSNNGTVTGATTTTSVYGGNAPILPRAIDIAESFAEQIGNGSASFDGNTNHINIGQPSVLATLGGSDFAITCWINPDAVSGAFDGLLYIGQAPSSNGHLGINSSGYLSGGTGDGSNWVTVQSTTNLLVVGEWAHCAMVRKNNVIYLYKNGIEIKQGSHSVIPSALDEDAWIAQGGSGEYYDGNISQVGIWRGALSQSQVQEVLEATSYQKLPASVKSTLGSEKVGDSSFEDASYWTTLLGNGGVDVNTTNAGKLTVANAHETRLSKAGILENGKLYKLDFVIDSYASGRIRGLAGFTDFFIPEIGTNTKYFVASGTDFSIHFDKYGIPSNTNATLTMTDISIKEVTNDLVAYYPLDSDSEVKGLSFDGSDDKITFTRQVFSGAFTISWWFNGDTETHHQSIFNDSTGANNNILIKDSNGFVTIRINGTYKAIITAVPHNEWCHIVFTRDGSGNIKSYLNGVAKGTSSTTDEFALDMIGDGCVMSMSSASMYNVEKSANEVLSIYNDGIGGDESSNSGLVGYYKMDNATTVVDNSSNSNNGTVTGATLISAGTTDSVGNNDGELY